MPADFIPYHASVFTTPDSASAQGRCCVCGYKACWMQERQRGTFFAYCAQCRQKQFIRQQSPLAREILRFVTRCPGLAISPLVLTSKATQPQIDLALATLRQSGLLTDTNRLVPPAAPSFALATRPLSVIPVTRARPTAWFLFAMFPDGTFQRLAPAFKTRKAALNQARRTSPIPGVTGLALGHGDNPSTSRIFSCWKT